MIRGKTLASISANDLQTLVDNQEREDQTIEYKVQLPESNPDGAVKFLSQISSFANTGGGDLVFGIEAVNGIPTKVVGLPGVNVDQEKLRLSQLMQSSLTALFVCLEPLWLSPTRGAGRLNLSEEGDKPRPIGVQIEEIPTHAGDPCLIVRVPRSLVGPHVVEHGRHWRFYGRNSAGKYMLDVGELRSSFLSSQDTVDRVRAFRADRLVLLEANDLPIELTADDRLIIHIVPAGAFDPRGTVSLSNIEQTLWSVPLLFDTSSNGRYNSDGYLRFTSSTTTTHVLLS